MWSAGRPTRSTSSSRSEMRRPHALEHGSMKCFEMLNHCTQARSMLCLHTQIGPAPHLVTLKVGGASSKQKLGSRPLRKLMFTVAILGPPRFIVLLAATQGVLRSCLRRHGVVLPLTPMFLTPWFPRFPPSSFQRPIGAIPERGYGGGGPELRLRCRGLPHIETPVWKAGPQRTDARRWCKTK